MAGFLLAALYIVGTAIVLVTGKHWSKRLAEQLRSECKPVFSVAAGGGFLCGFVWLVSDFLGSTPPGLFSALIGLLLLRQLLSRAADAAVEIASLYGQRANLSALFFHRQVLLRNAEEAKGIWSLFERQRRAAWIVPVLAELTDIPEPTRIETRWHQTGIRNVLALEARVEGEIEPAWLLRLFDRRRSALAAHEAALFGAAVPVDRLPAPAFLGATRVAGFRCHGFLWSRLQRVPAHEARAAKASVMKQLLEVEPPPDLLARYERSHPFLWRRIVGASALACSWLRRCPVSAR